MWFVNKRDEGILFDEYFNLLTKECLALVLTAVTILTFYSFLVLN